MPKLRIAESDYAAAQKVAKAYGFKLSDVEQAGGGTTFRAKPRGMLRVLRAQGMDVEMQVVRGSDLHEVGGGPAVSKSSAKRVAALKKVTKKKGARRGPK